MMFIYFSSQGSSLIGCLSRRLLLSIVFVHVTCADVFYIDVCSDLVFGSMCSILLPTMRSYIFGSLSLLIVVADGRVLVICHNRYHRWTLWGTYMILIGCHNCVNECNKIVLSCFLLCDCHRLVLSNWGSISTFKRTCFLQRVLFLLLILLLVS